MKRALEGIRGVVGVSGVIIWDKIGGECHHLMPARVDETQAELMCRQLLLFCEKPNAAEHLAVKYEKGWLLLFNDPGVAVMVMARDDLNRATLNLVVKSVLRTVSAEMARNKAAGLASSWREEHIDLLVRAINLSLAWFQKRIPKFTIAQLLHQSKEDLLTEYPVLKYVTVDANGGVMVKHDARDKFDSTFLPAAVQLLKAFLELALAKGSHSGFDLEKQTEELKQPLIQLGFYQLYVGRESVEQA